MTIAGWARTEAKVVPGRARAEAVIPSLWIPTPIIVSMTAAKIEMKDTMEKLTKEMGKLQHVLPRNGKASLHILGQLAVGARKCQDQTDDGNNHRPDHRAVQ